jgi:hypothetical protein
MGKPLANSIPRDMHNHPVNPYAKIGLPSVVCKITNRLIAKDKDLRPQEVIVEIKTFLLNGLPSEHELKSTGTDDEVWESLKEKVRNCIKYQRKRNRGDYAVSTTVQYIINIC